MVKTWTPQRPPAAKQWHKPEYHRDGLGYSSRTWRTLSLAWLRTYPLCVLCLARGRVNQGAGENASAVQRNLIVDHIRPHKGDTELFWDQDNWQTLCRMPCHDRDKRRSEGAGREWFAWLRKIVEQDGTRETVLAYQNLLPERIAIELLRSEAG